MVDLRDDLACFLVLTGMHLFVVSPLHGTASFLFWLLFYYLICVVSLDVMNNNNNNKNPKDTFLSFIM
jgi:hypothetical protein